MVSWIYVIIGSGERLLPFGAKPLPEPMDIFDLMHGKKLDIWIKNAAICIQENAC